MDDERRRHHAVGLVDRLVLTEPRLVQHHVDHRVALGDAAAEIAVGRILDQDEAAGLVVSKKSIETLHEKIPPAAARQHGGDFVAREDRLHRS